MLNRERHKTKGTCATKPGTLLKQQILVRTFWCRDDRQPGFCEIDTVSRDGGFAQGEYAFTLSITDVRVCWSEFRPLKNKAQKWTVQALQDIYDTFPLPIKGLDSDNGAEFINWYLETWRETNRIIFTRGRQYHKNDDAFIEQKKRRICEREPKTPFKRILGLLDTEVPRRSNSGPLNKKNPWVSSHSRKNWTRLLNGLTVLFIGFPVPLSVLNPKVGF
jgi:hypothetical protein